MRSINNKSHGGLLELSAALFAQCIKLRTNHEKGLKCELDV